MITAYPTPSRNEVTLRPSVFYHICWLSFLTTWFPTSFLGAEGVSEHGIASRVDTNVYTTSLRNRYHESLMQSPPHARSESLWLEDGSIVLQAEGKQFKVYRGLLALQSTVFKDIFGFPQPPSGEELVEGCHIVHLSDTAVDVEFVLEEMVLRRWLPAKWPLPIAVIAAFLRLGTKYDIPILRAEALKRLFFEFPADLADFDRLLDQDYSGTMIQPAASTFDSWTCVDAANMAREHDVLSILPIALYWCCAKRSAAELEEGQRIDGTISVLSPVKERACFRAHFPLFKLKEETTFSWVISPKSAYPACYNSQCSITRDNLLRTILFPVAVRGCFEVWKHEWGAGQCSSCINVARQRHEEGRQKAWDALPGVFGLPGWEELRKERSALA